MDNWKKYILYTMLGIAFILLFGLEIDRFWNHPEIPQSQFFWEHWKIYVLAFILLTSSFIPLKLSQPYDKS